MIDQKGFEPYSSVLVKLLLGPLYSEDRKYWEILLAHRQSIEIYFSKIAMQLQIHDSDGFAYIKQYSDEEMSEENFPISRLLRRMPLTYEVTLLIVLLRERLQQFEIESGQGLRLVMSKKELREMVTIFFKEKADEVKLLRNIDSVIQKVVDLGFLKLLRSSKKDQYEIMRLIKAKLQAEDLEHLRQELEKHNNLESKDTP